MESTKKIVSDDGRKIIHIVKSTDGKFSLRRSVIKYDEEEGVNYEVSLNSDNSIFGSKELAISEAKRVLNETW